MKQYDCIFSLGEACFIAIALKKNGLRTFFGPFDWMYGSNFKTRCDILISKFDNYFNKEDLEFKEYREANKMVTYRNTRTDIYYNHDFYSDLPFDYEYDIVKEKYERRINRLLKIISKAKKVLICYGDLANTKGGASSDNEIIECVKKLNEVYAPAQIDMLYIRHNPKMKDGEVVFESVSDNVIIANTYSQNREPNNYLGNDVSLKAVLKNIKIKVRLRCHFSKIWKKIYKIQEGKKGLKFKFSGITIFKLKFPLVLEYYKKKFVLEQKKNIQTIALGSSHGNRGINSMFMSQPTVNLCTTSQDLYQSYKMFEYALKNCSTIKNVILFYSPFSSGFNISHSSEKYRTAFMNTVFGIKPYKEDNSINKKLYKKASKCFLKNISINADNNPLFESEELIEEEIKKRALKHMEFAQKTSMNEYLIKIIEIAKQEKLKLYVIIPPFTKTYKKYISEDAFSKMKDICKKYGISCISFYDDRDFNDADFHDADHLNILGSIKLTSKIDKLMEAKKWD